MINPHPRLPEFEYVKPDSLAEASKFLAEHSGEARPLSGGTDIFVRMRDGVWKDQYLVDIKVFEETRQLSFDSSNGLVIGAGVPMNKVIVFPEVVKNYPLLAEAAQTVASYQLRSRATVVGNICNASPAGDTIGTSIVYEGKLNIHGVSGNRTEPLSSFFIGPGKTVLKPGDIVTSVVFPVPPKEHVGRYIKLGRNALGDLAIIGTTVMAYPSKDSASGFRFRVCLASVAPVPLRIKEVEEYLEEKAITADRLDEAAKMAMEACSPIDDVRGSARYRKMMVRNQTRKALQEVWEKINQS